ncbi:hypothetical protein BGZ98_006613 [Dissophora globulifera]|nr:hypothetical protein BGZ98_006613 [Dissophora globulifera]
MFKKPVASLKTSSPLRSSDKRRLRDEILARFPALLQFDDANPATGSSIIVPNGLEFSKFISYAEEPGIFYTDAEGTPLWFRIGNSKDDAMIVPTVYMLWKYPTIIPALTTWGPVVDKLRNGADLMIPGIITAGDTEVPDLPEGALVAILARGNKYPLGVGTMATSGHSIAASRGGVPPRGKAVHMLHVHQDHLWTMGSQPDFPADWQEGPKTLLDDEYESSGDELEDKGDATEVAKALKDVAISDPKGKAPVRDEEPQGTDKETDSTAAESHQDHQSESVELSTEEVDQYLQEALLQVLKFKITESEAKELLPLNVSTLYSSYILPNRAPGRAAEADIKKSSWKKLAKWLKAVEKQGLIKCKEIKGELFLQGVTWKHPQLDAFRGHKTVAQQAARQAKVEAKLSQANSDAKVLEVLEAYRPNSSSAGFFEAVGQSKDGYYSLQEVQSLLLEYIKEKQLSDPKNQRVVRLDGILAEALKKEGEPKDRVQKSESRDRLVNNMVPHYFVGYRGQQPHFVKGVLKPIHMLHDFRMGRFTTKVSGLERFLIDIDAFAREIQVLCAGSVSMGASPKLNLREVAVQGRQARIVAEVLLEKGVPKNFMELVDKTGSKEKLFQTQGATKNASASTPRSKNAGA